MAELEFFRRSSDSDDASIDVQFEFLSELGAPKKGWWFDGLIFEPIAPPSQCADGIMSPISSGSQLGSG